MENFSSRQAVPATYGDFPLPALHAEMKQEKALIAAAKIKLDLLNYEVERRFGDALAEKRSEQDKLSTTLNIDDEFKVKGSVSKKVTWDSGICQTIAASMSWDQAHHFFKIKFTVAEAIFKAIEPGTLKDAMTKARTVEYGEPKVELIAKS